MADDNNNNLRQRDIRKSQFAAVTQSQASDYFDLVRNGQNLKIRQSDLVNDMGATGSLQTLGEVAATPVLKIVSDVNYIRNILGASGIVSSVSAQDGVQLDHNFKANKDGTAVLINESAIQPVIRSLVAGNGINIAGADETIQIAVADAPVSTKTVLVSTEDDFPDAIGGVITLLGDTEYRLINDVQTANRFVMGSRTVLSGNDSFMIELDYTGTGVMITSADVTSKITDMALKCSTGTLFDISSTSGFDNFFFTSVTVTECDIIGTIDNVFATIWEYARFPSVLSDGMTWSGTIQIAQFFTITGQALSGSHNFFSLGTAVFTVWNMMTSYFIWNATGNIINGLPDSGNIAADGLGTFNRCHQFGTAFPVVNIDEYDDRWSIFQSSHTDDSTNLALTTNPGVTITITTQDVPVRIGPSWSEETMRRFTHDANGRWTYTGVGAQIDINLSLSGERAASGTDNYGFYIYVNDVQVTESLVVRNFTNSAGNISLVWALTLDTDDYVEVWVENQDGTTDFILNSATLRMS